MEQDKFLLEIITPLKSETFAIEWIEIESPSGSFLVGPHHSPLVSIIRNKSTITYKPSHEEPCSLKISCGIFKVENLKACILLDT